MVPTEAVLIVAGLQVPVMPLVEVPGSRGAVAFWQRGPMAAKVGVMLAFTVMLSVAVVAHCPAVGVKV